MWGGEAKGLGGERTEGEWGREGHLSGKAAVTRACKQTVGALLGMPGSSSARGVGSCPARALSADPQQHSQAAAAQHTHTLTHTAAPHTAHTRHTWKHSIT